MEGGDLRMTTIDERVTSLKFDNKQFQAATKDTLASLAALNKGLKLDGATKGLTDLGAASKNVSLSHLGSAADQVAARFSAMSVVAITALATITHRAIAAGTQIVKSLTVDPISSGLKEYELNLNSIQTILANTVAAGVTLEQVSSALEELNRYSDQTIYNFAEMARNIGTFTSAGVALEPAVQAIKGIANLAALSGSNSLQAATAMYQLSQAISSGRVALIDWTSVVNAGMGGPVFQRALAQTAIKMGTLSKSSLTLAGDMKTVKINGEAFRDSLQEGWLSADVLTKTLAQFTGDLTDAELAIQGFNKTEIEAIQKQAAAAKEAATVVKTMSQLLSTLRESAGSGWAKTWELIFGGFDEAKVLFTNVNNVIGGFIEASAEARNKVLGDWNELGGRTAIIEAIGNTFNALIEVVKPIRDAFREIFPATTGKQLYDLSIAIRDFTQNLKIGAGTADNLRRTFAGVFAVFGIGLDVAKEVAKVLLRLFGVALDGSGSFLEITANVGDFLVALRQAIKDGKGLEKVFGAIGDVLEIPLKIIKFLGEALASLFEGFNPQGAAKSITGIVGQLEPITRISEGIVTAWEKVVTVLDNVWTFFLPLANKFSSFFDKFGISIAESLQDLDFQDVLGAINTGLFAGLLLMIRNVIGGGGIGGIFENVRESFEQLTNTMQSMQNTLRAATLLQIATAIGILTISVSALSKIDAAGLTRALTAITVMFVQLFTAMAIFQKVAGFSGLAQMPLVTAALILLGIAVNILASAVKKLADLSWNELAKGLTGLTVILGVLITTVKLMPPSAGIVSTSFALILLAGAVKILVSAVTDFSGLDWEEISKGLVGVGAVLTALALFSKFSAADKGGVLQGAGILLLAAGIKVLASAMLDFATLDWQEIAKGLASMAGGLGLIGAALYLIPPSSVFSATGVLIAATSLGMIAGALKQLSSLSWGDVGKGLTTLAAALTIIGAALTLIPPTALLSAAGVLVVAASLGMIADALEDMGKMSWKAIARGLTALAGSLGIISAAMILMSGALPGAAALLVVAGSLAILAPVLQMFSQMSLEEMGKSLLMLAGVFTVLGLAGLVLTPVIPTLLGLGVAITLLGAGLLLGGAGLLAFSIGLTALSVAGAAGTATLVALVAGLAGLIPLIMTQLGVGVVAFAKVIAVSGPAIQDAITAVMLGLIKSVDELTPQFIETFMKIVTTLLKELEEKTPEIVDSGYKILIAVLEGIKKNIRKVSKLALEILAEFIKGVSDGIPSVVQAGVNMMISFIEALTKAVNDNSERMGKAGADLGLAIIKGMVKGILSGISSVSSAARDVAKASLKAAMKALGIASPSKEFFALGRNSSESLGIGVRKFGFVAENAAAEVGEDSILALRKTLSGLSDLIKGDMDMTPTITPVLDLTKIRKDADEIGSMFRTKPLSLGTSYSTAKDVAISKQDDPDDFDFDDRGTRGPDVTFTQNNYSPKALPVSEIYRQTNNQLSKMEGLVAP
jgi:tape measure domain-containing protein